MRSHADTWIHQKELIWKIYKEGLVHFARRFAAAQQPSIAHRVHTPEGFYCIENEVSYTIIKEISDH